LKTINLTVPFFSQRDNNYIWHYKREKDEEIKKKTFKKGSPVTDSAGNEITSKIWDGCCNITCLAMVLNYLGVTQDTPYKMCQKIFADDYPSNPLKHADFDRYIKYRTDSNVKASDGYECIENVNILKRIATDIYKVRNVYTSSSTYTIDDIKKEIETGYPVIVSCGITRPSSKWLENEMKNNSNPSDSTKSAYNALQKDVNYEYHGHYIVVRGFTKEGNVIINDPWGKATNNAGRIPNELIENAPQDAWGYYSANIYDGTNKGENIIITKSDFERQYHGKFWSVLIIYDRRWSFPFKDCLTNHIKIDEGSQKRYIPDPVQVEACYKLQTSGVYYPITSTCKPHNGIHISNGKYSPFYSIGSGMLVAAKLCNKKNEIINNGSNCFILVKHQIQLPKKYVDSFTEVKTFFCLYNHIKPIQFTDEDFSKIRFLNELSNERDKDKEKKSYFDSSNGNNLTNVLQEEAKEKIEKLMSGETVIFNEGRIISEVAEGDYLGQTYSKGFYPTTGRYCMHWEIFSNENFFSDKSEYSEYNIIDFTEINHYNRAEVIELCKDVLFKSYCEDVNYSRYLKHLDKNAIAPIGIDAYYSTKYSEKARYIVLHNKSEWDTNRDFVTEYSDSNQKGYIKVENLIEFNENYIKPFLWWNREIDNAINEKLEKKIVNKSPYYYEPINFLLWLMKNDDELYKQICPKSYEKEFV